MIKLIQKIDLETGISFLEKVKSDELTSGLADKYRIFTFNTAMDVWDCVHNLEKEPAVQLSDTFGNQLYGQVQHISVNRTVITFTEAITGYAKFN